jgi:predicted permease
MRLERWIYSIPLKLRSLLLRHRVEQELDEELQYHLARKTDEFLAQGMPPEDARRTALRSMDGWELRKEQCRDARGLNFLEALLQDVRFGLRILRKSPGFTLISLMTVAIGIAANVCVFSIVDEFLLSSVPARDAAGLVRIEGAYSYPEYAYLRDHAQTLREVAAHYSTAPLYVTINGESGELQGAVVSSSYFSMLGLQPYLGRFFTPAEDSLPDRDALAVLSYEMWRGTYGGDPNILGKTLFINQQTFTIIGVMAEDFRGVIMGGVPNQVWIPSMMLRVGYRWCSAFEPGCTPLELMGRLAPARTIAQAQAEVAGLLRQLRSTAPGFDERQTISLTSHSDIAGDRRYAAELLRILAVTAGLLLLVVCANLGGLLLARGPGRTSEIAMRLTLGAARGRVVRQLLTENLILAGIGGALGVVLSSWISKLLLDFYAVDDEGYRHFYDLRPDPIVFIYSMVITAVAAMLFGLLPAWRTSRVDLNESLKGAGSVSASGRTWSRVTLVAVQLAFSLALIVAAGLLTRSTASIEGGHNMDVHHVLGLRLRPKLLEYPPQKAQAFEQEAVRRLRELPGVESVSLAEGHGFVWQGNGRMRLILPGKIYPKPADEPIVRDFGIAPDYFTTLRIPFVAGRDFNQHDIPASPRVAIVNETLAHEILPAGLPLGRSISLDGVPYQIVGIVKDAQFHSALQGPVPVAYVDYWQNENEVDARMCVRVAGDPAAASPAIRKTIASIDPDVPVTETLPLIDQVRGTYVDLRVASAALTAVSALAIFLCAMGLYAVIAYDVKRRTREIGVRMALGAKPGQVVKLFVKQGVLLVLIGSVAGLALALAATRLLASYLFGVRPLDPATFSLAGAFLLAVALLASYLPSRKASRVGPMVALRHE